MKKVMLVEDEEFILQGIRCIIDWEEISMTVVSMAHNGREALEMFRKEPADIVVTDVEMPLMNGLELLEEIRKIDPRTRCIILSGYDEFEYARTALKLDVEEYILKPVNEEQLKEALIHAAEHFDEIDRKKAGNMEDKIGWHRFLKGRLDETEAEAFIGMLPEIEPGETVTAAMMKIDAGSLERKDGMQDVLVGLQKLPRKLKTIYLSPDTLFLLLYTGQGDVYTKQEDVYTEQEDAYTKRKEDSIGGCRESGGEGAEMLGGSWEPRKIGGIGSEKAGLIGHPESSMAAELFGSFQDHLESTCGILSFFTIGPSIREYRELPACYKIISRLQKYRLLEGYGVCITESFIKDRKTQDVAIDENLLRKMILKKDKEGALNYIEDLFINNLKSEVDVDVLYQLALKMAVLLQDIKVEYKLEQSTNLQALTEMIEKIYQADDIFGLKTIFISEITEIILYLHTEDSQYTPVVKQIMEEVRKNYKEDMNLKTLAYKYHMNASYLGQIFQKEVGCSFTQYLSNMKNKIAKDLILNTNLKINDIAKEVGYPDTSYFYRKFKQCYGVSPASLRGMKKY